MIPLIVGTGDIGTKNPIVYGSTPSITLNNPADDPQDTYMVEDITVQPTWDVQIEPKPDRDGSTAGAPREVQKIIVLRGWVKALTYAGLYDKIHALNRAFNPVLAYQGDNSADDIGFLPLSFDVPTADTTNWPSGIISCRYRVQSMAIPIPLQTKFDNLQARFTLQLRAIDPRRYEQAQQSVNTTGNSALALDNTKATYESFPTIVLAITTQPTVDFSIIFNGVNVLFFDYTRFSGHSSLTINCQSRSARWDNGADATDAIKATSTFFAVPAAVNHNIQAVSAPSDMSLTVTWNRAFA